MPELITVANVADVPAGQGRVVEAGGRQIAVFNVDGCFYAIDNTCIHRGGPLGEGEVEGKIVTCPWHGWRYDVTTGAREHTPNQPGVACFETRVEGGEVKVLL
jgi:nitrite reductase/ring-hydroxylating ferredoxin subunit